MKFLKIGGVILGALIITTLGISASDTFSGNAGSLLGQLSGEGETSACPSGMTEVVVGQTFSCVDTYEVSPSELCPVTEPSVMQETQLNLNTLECVPVSQVSVRPWTYVTRAQAQALCARAGKRLPSSSEWFTFAAGTRDMDDMCNTGSGSLASTGSYKECISGAKVYDTVGNVWEWTSDDIFEGQLGGRSLPTEGFVSQVDSAGIATQTSGAPSLEFGADYFWQTESGNFGILRGGFYGSGSDAGVYAVHGKTPPTAATVAIGFRCVR